MVRDITRYNKEIRVKAEELRKSGQSYRQIFDSLKIPKSTLSNWLGQKYPGIFDKNKRNEHLTRVRVSALEVLRKRKELEINEIGNKVRKEIETFPLSNKGFLKSVLSALYWAEGGKYHGSPLVFANTDPKLAKLFITLLRKCFVLDEAKLRIRLHLHRYHNITNSRQYWSELLNVPVDKFGKIYIKKRSPTRKFRKNFAGICFIKYHDKRLQREIMEIANQLAEKII